MIPQTARMRTEVARAQRVDTRLRGTRLMAGRPGDEREKIRFLHCFSFILSSLRPPFHTPVSIFPPPRPESSLPVIFLLSVPLKIW